MLIKPNILLVVPRLNIGGAESYVLTLAQGLNRRGYRVVVASWGGSLVNLLEQTGIRHCHIPVRMHPRLTSLLLEFIIRRHNIDIVHANSAAAGIGALYVCQKLGIPLVYTAHGVIGNNAEEMKLAAADVIICVSQFLRDLLISNGFAGNNLEVVYNGVELNKFLPDQGGWSSMRNKLGFTDQHIVIGLIARIRNLNHKGHRDMLDILKRDPETRHWRLMVVGKGTGLLRLRYETIRAGLGKKVVFCGYQVNIPQYMQAMDIVVLPSRFETFGLVLTEAQSMAKPVVAYRSSGMQEAVEHDKTGLLVVPGAVDDFFQAINYYAKNKQQAEEAGRNGQDRVARLFTSDQMLDKILGIYYRVLAEKKEGCF